MIYLVIPWLHIDNRLGIDISVISNSKWDGIAIVMAMRMTKLIQCGISFVPICNASIKLTYKHSHAFPQLITTHLCTDKNVTEHFSNIDTKFYWYFHYLLFIDKLRQMAFGLSWLSIQSSCASCISKTSSTPTDITIDNIPVMMILEINDFIPEYRVYDEWAIAQCRWSKSWYYDPKHMDMYNDLVPLLLPWFNFNPGMDK